MFLASAAVPAPLPWAVGLAYAQEPAEVLAGPEVTAVMFEGAETLDPELLEAAIFTRPTSCRSPLFFLFCALGLDFALEERYLDREELARDEERLVLLYEAWGFPDAAVSASVEPADGDEVEVTFRIVEGEPIRVGALEVRGLDALEPPVELPEPLPLEVGGLYALPLLDSTQTVIRRAFAERGRPYAQVEVGGAVDEAARVATVVLEVAPGPAVVFGETTIEAESPIEEEVVRERLAYAPGDTFRPSAIEETQRRLFALPIVERVVVDPVGLEAGATVVEPRLVVESRRTAGFQVEGTISSTECLELAGFWTSRYFLGGPRLFSLGVGFSNLLADQLGGFPCTGVDDDDEVDDAFTDLNYFVNADLRQPWPGDPRTALLLRGYLVRETAPRVYVRRGYGGQVGVAREFRPELTGSALYSPSRNELTGAEFFFCGTYGVCDAEGLDELTEFTWLSPVEVFAVWTPEGPPVQVRPPEPGERWRRWVRAGVEGAAFFTGSEYDYARTLDEAGVTRVLGERGELAAHTRIGLLLGADEVLPPQVRLYSGGVNTVRGVSQNLLGPKFLVASRGNLDAIGCILEPGGCPAGITVDPDLVAVRPTGGELLLEGNLEARRWVTDALQAALFVDLGVLARDPWGDDDDALVSDDWEALATPGIGIRILTGLGPIRIDLAYDPSGDRDVPLLTRDEDGDLVVLGEVRYAPFTFDDPGFFTELRRRLQLQVAIGQPF
ncbi:MAG TPA: POTRA domain-containing protein [Longimicrobiales bacterium]